MTRCLTIDALDMETGPIPDSVLKKADTFLVFVSGHRRDSAEDSGWVTQDIYSELILIHYDWCRKIFYVKGDQKDEVLTSDIEAWLPVVY